jgi:hypothetical protein
VKKKSTKPKAVRVRHGGMTITARKRKGGWFHDVSEFHGPYRSARAALQEAAELVDLANS